MSQHKDDCIWKDGYFESIIARTNGPDSYLRIDQDGIFYLSNEWTTNEDDYSILFNHCPICGVKL